MRYRHESKVVQQLLDPGSKVARRSVKKRKVRLLSEIMKSLKFFWPFFSMSVYIFVFIFWYRSNTYNYEYLLFVSPGNPSFFDAFVIATLPFPCNGILVVLGNLCWLSQCFLWIMLVFLSPISISNLFLLGMAPF